MEIRIKDCRSAVSPSGLPGLDWAINPYRGCSHACAYCYAQDVTRFETSREWGEVIEVKSRIVERLSRSLAKAAPRGVYGVGTVTDPYQPLEREYRSTRGCLELLRGRAASVSILTKSDLVLRDLDLLKGWREAEVGISVGIVDPEAARIIEPRAPPPDSRLKALAELADNGVLVYLMAAPIIPGISDSRESIGELVARAHGSGVRRILWDKFNPKPLASSRLSRALSANGIEPRMPHSQGEACRVRALFREECGRLGIDLIDAF